MTSMDPARFRWRKSSYSGGSGNDCVELAALPAATVVRDSKNPGGGILLLSDSMWSGFRAMMQAGADQPPTE